MNKPKGFTPPATPTQPADPWTETESAKSEPIANAPLPTPEPVVPIPVPPKPPEPELWSGGTLRLTNEVLQALQKGEDTLLLSNRPQYILYVTGQPESDLIIRVNSLAAAAFRASSPDVIVPRQCHNDFTQERAALANLRGQEHFDIGYTLKCYDSRTVITVSEHHERLAVGIWLVTIVKQ